jgi:outer membrane protein
MRATFLLLLLFAATIISAAELKVGYVNVMDVLKAIDESPKAEAVRKKLQEEFKARDNDLVAKQKQLKELEQSLSKEGSTMSAEERRRLEKDIVTRGRKLKNDKDAFREDFNLRRNEESAKMRKTILETIREFAREGNYDLILTDGVVHFSEHVDITNKVLEKLK